MSQSSPKIVIVGAGLSGFSAAAKLMENGFNDIIVLEAENRTGGRVHSIPYANGSLDMGAQWCHGQRKNVIYELVSKHFKFGSTGFDDTYELFLSSSGQIPNQKQCLRLRSLGETIMESSYDDMEKFNGSLGDFFTSKYRQALTGKKHADIPAELSNQMLDFLHKDTNAEFASPTWFDISARLNAQSDSASGKQDLTWKTQGFQTVFDFITVRTFTTFHHLKLKVFFSTFRKSFPTHQSSSTLAAKFS